MLSDLTKEEKSGASIPRPNLDQSLAEIRKQNEYFTTDEQRNITLRSLEENWHD